MQTFLPYASFYESARCLDNRRLGKQRVECKQILLALTQENYGWKNHPATKMWSSAPYLLAEYGYAVCLVWRERGFNDSLLPYFENKVDEGYDIYEGLPQGKPLWMYEPIAEQVYASHRSNLLRKNPGWYGQFGWAEPDNLPYVWPVK